MNIRTGMTLMAAALALAVGASWAQQKGAPAGGMKLSDGVVKIGILTDLSGLYSDISGAGSLTAAKMAIEDFQAKEGNKAFPIELVYADHQNKGDVASNKAREWFERDKVDMIGDLVTTSTALAVMPVAKQANRITIVSGAASTLITGKNCTDTNIHDVYDTYALANGTGKAVVKQGGDSWFFLTADYAFGHSLENDTGAVVKANGGKVVGSIRHPFPGTDFSSFLLKAQSSGAKVIGLANAGTDTTNSIRQAAEFGITGKQSLAGLLMFLSDIHTLGLKTAQGMYLTEGFYWDLNAETRAWSKRYYDKHKRMPTMVHAGVYSSTMHYLNAVKAAGTDDTKTVMAKMKSTPVNDFFAKNGRIREDGRHVHDFYLLQVKKPEESKAPWDYYHVRQVIPAADAVLPAERSECPLLKK
jgi:branched-chain amino acid transport system substrate-binding protein